MRPWSPVRQCGQTRRQDVPDYYDAHQGFRVGFCQTLNTKPTTLLTTLQTLLVSLILFHFLF